MVGVLAWTVLHWQRRGPPTVEVLIRDLNLFHGRVLYLCLPREEERRILFLMNVHNDPKSQVSKTEKKV